DAIQHDPLIKLLRQCSTHIQQVASPRLLGILRHPPRSLRQRRRRKKYSTITDPSDDSRQPNCWITIEATAGCVPPASGVIVSTGVFPAGLRTSTVELAAVVLMSALPAISLVPVAR